MKFRSLIHLTGVHSVRTVEVKERLSGGDQLVHVYHRGRDDVVPVGPVKLKALVDENDGVGGRCVPTRQLEAQDDLFAA